MAMCGIMTQGGQPGYLSPNPQVLGANMPPVGQPNRPQLQFPGCSDVQSVGSPILLAYQAQKLIDEAMKVQNQQTFVRYLYFKTISSSSAFSVHYKLIFEVRDQSQTNYVGILLDNPTNGIGSAKFLKFILNSNITIVKKVLQITEDLPASAFVCGDLKMIFSSFGNDPRTKLPGSYPGANRNAVPPAILKALKELTADGNAGPGNAGANSRDCSSTRFINTSTSYSAESPLNAGSTPFSEVRCDPTGIPVVKSITMYCSLSTHAGAIVTNPLGDIIGIQFTYGVPFTTSTVQGTLLGTNTGIPAGSTLSTININLAGAHKIETYYRAPTTAFTLRGPFYDIVLYDSNNQRMGVYNCGANGLAYVTAISPNPVVKETFLVKDLLGVYGSTTGAGGYPYNGAINNLGFITYV